MQDLARRDGPKSLGTVALLGLGFLILAALLTLIFVVQQRSSGAYTAEFSTLAPDEAGHVVTGLMVADYLAAGLPALHGFMADYALHLPAVAGEFSAPLYYIAEGAWFTLLQPSTPAVLLLPAVLAALLVASAGWICAERIGVLPAVAVGAVLMVLTPLRHATITVGLALPLALLALWAAMAWLAFLERQRPRDGLLFGLLAAAAALTHPAGLALALLPILSLGLSGTTGLVRHRAFWLAFLPLLLTAPWFLGAGPIAAAGLPAPIAFAVANGAALWAELLERLGSVLTALAIAGAAFALVDARRADAPRLLPVLLLLAVVLTLALCLVPPTEGQARLVVILVPAVMLAAAGGVRLVGLLTSGWPILAGLLVMLVMLLAAMPALLLPVTKPGNGMDAAAQTFLADAGGPASILVVADRQGEGALIAAVAQRDRLRQSVVRPARTVLAAPVPAAGASRDVDPAELMAALERVGAGYVLIAPTAEAWLKNAMEAALVAFPERFKRIGRFAGVGEGEGTRLYALVSSPAAMR